jgi:dolichol-phosphate mannosyltransferase
MKTEEENVPARVLVTVFVYNEGQKFGSLLQEIPADAPYEVLILNDGSTDEIGDYISDTPHTVIENDRNRGLGYSFKRAIRYAIDEGFDIFIPIAGNGKMRPAEIPLVIAPLLGGEADYVQGSRYLPGGRRDHLPLFRDVMIRLLAWILTIFTGRRITDSTCGFRAYRLSLFHEIGVDIWQDWLDKYELENYLSYKVLNSEKRYVEVPVSMIYPESKRNYSKIRPLVGWWSIVKPFVYLTLGVRK